MSEVVAEYEHLRILWDAQLRTVHMQWLAPVGGAPFREGLDEGLALLASKKASRWLADLRWLGVMARSDEAWVNNEWFGRAIEQGLKYMAIVTPESSKAQISLRELMQALPAQQLVATEQLTTQSFEGLDDARGWLSHQG